MRIRRYPTVTPEGQPFRAPEPTHVYAEAPHWQHAPKQSRAALAQFQGRVCPELHEAVQRKAGHAHHA